METITFNFDEKGYAYDYAPSLESNELPERGGYFAIHNNTQINPGSFAFSVSFFAIDEECTDYNSWTFDFRDFESVTRYFRALGLKFDSEAEPVRQFLRTF